MGWVSQGFSTSTLSWTYASLEGGMTRRDFAPTYSSSLWYVDTPRTFNPNKRYIFQTTVDDFDSHGSGGITHPKFLELVTPWGATFGYEEDLTNIWEDTRPPFAGDIDLFFISSPNSTITSSDIVEYKSTYNGFGNPSSDSNGTPVIKNFKLIETDWYFQGWAFNDNTSYTEGWHYDESSDKFVHNIVRFGSVDSISLVSGGLGYLDDDIGANYIIESGQGTASISDGSGWGSSVKFSISGGALTIVNLVGGSTGDVSRGHSYLEGDTITIPGGSSNATVNIDGVLGDSGGDRRKPIGGHTASNYIARYIEYPVFNITFDADTSPSPESYMSLYLVDRLPPTTNNPTTFASNLSNGQFLGNITSSDPGTYTFYNLTGQKYLLITSNYYLPFSGATRVEIYNFLIEGSYQENDNNTQFLFTESGTYSEPTELCLIGGSSDATYSVIVVNEETLHNPATNSFFGPTGFPGFFSNLYGNVINLNALNAKVGNGTFKAGIWENGVWNSGWRVDNASYDFDDVEISLLMETKNTRWRIQLTGPQTSTQNFSVGDKVSIGNIVGIDINENRKLMKNYFTVLSVNNNNIIVDFNNTFPLRRIEKDSENHKIKVTKNVWLNGGFLNGYFEGIWNNGLFKGFPYITEMYNSHWIDGKYDGGHFYGEYPEYTYVDTYYWSPTTPNTLGLTFGATAHGFVVGDLVEIDKDDKSINPQYDGFATVIEVIDDYLIIVDKGFGASSTLEGGKIRRRTGTGVIQNFEFYDNNISTSTTQDTFNLKAIYNYNSWVDVKYLDESASNLGRNLISYDSEIGEYSENNLYGYITKDVLSSVSSFRNSFSLGKSLYSLGTKYKIYEDFIGDASEFNEPFNTSGSPGMDNFFNNGWTYSSTTPPTIERTNEQLMQLSLSPLSHFLLKNENISIEKRRYSIVEFDLNQYTPNVTDKIELFPPFIIRKTPRLYITSPKNTYIPGSYNLAFPVSTKVRHTLTNNVKKYEYFFNKRDLNIGLDARQGSFGIINWTGLTASFDNIKMYELDMIPFFQYTTEEYVNKAVQVPYQGIAPFIDYSDDEFSFIDNINIGFDSLNTQQSANPPSGNGDYGRDIYNDPATPFYEPGFFGDFGTNFTP